MNEPKMVNRKALFPGVLALCFIALHCQTPKRSSVGNDNWPVYGGDAGGQRYSHLNQINTSNVSQLQRAWTFHTNIFDKPSPFSNHRASFEATPVFWNGLLFFDSPFDTVFAVDARTGRQAWKYEPEIDREAQIYIVASRGVALWHGKSLSTMPCAQHRVFVATLDRRLIARDAATGVACTGFGVGGTVDLSANMKLSPRQTDMYGFTSPPTIIGDVVVVGSSVDDNYTVDTANGAVRGFDVSTGKQLWSWNPIPWANGKSFIAGSGNAWSIISADPEHDLIFVPTGSPAVDYYGGLRLGDNRDADSIVALRASTGQRVWAFQLVHHDLWDFDTPSQPLLFTFRNTIPAVAITTKTSMIYVFNRLTGEPLYPILERPVPPSDLAGEHAWPTQPFSSLPTLTPLSFKPEDVVFADKSEQGICRDILAHMVNKGIFTPPGTQKTLLYPSPLGGANWGSAAFDPASGEMYVHTNNVAYVMFQVPKPTTFLEHVERYIDHHSPAFLENALPPSRFHTPDGGDHTYQDGTPYELYRNPLMTPNDTPCTPQPWASIVAVNLNTGTKSWSVPLGTYGAGQHTGSFGMGGLAVTAGGLIFVGATREPLLRAFRSADGAELWKAQLSAPADATPMTYEVDGKQYVVVASGGHGMFGTSLSDEVVAYTLPDTVIAKPHKLRKRSASR